MPLNDGNISLVLACKVFEKIMRRDKFERMSQEAPVHPS